MRGTSNLEAALRAASLPGVKVAMRVASETSVSAACISVEVNLAFTLTTPLG